VTIACPEGGDEDCRKVPDAPFPPTLRKSVGEEILFGEEILWGICWKLGCRIETH
jgi:hypothetical protein